MPSLVLNLARTKQLTAEAIYERSDRIAVDLGLNVIHVISAARYLFPESAKTTRDLKSVTSAEQMSKLSQR
jgi:hypothetical protein